MRSLDVCAGSDLSRCIGYGIGARPPIVRHEDELGRKRRWKEGSMDHHELKPTSSHLTHSNFPVTLTTFTDMCITIACAFHSTVVVQCSQRIVKCILLDLSRRPSSFVEVRTGIQRFDHTVCHSTQFSSCSVVPKDHHMICLMMCRSRELERYRVTYEGSS